MNRYKKAIVAVAAVTLGLGFASSALGLTERQVYGNCLIDHPGLDYECCGSAGGSWVEIYDSKGNLIDEYCFVTDDEFEASPDGGTTQPRNDPRTGTTSGTYQQPQTTSSSGTTTGTTSGTYAR